MKRVNSESNTKQCLSIAESCASSKTVKTNNNGTTAAQVNNDESKSAQTFRFELWSTYTKKIENVKSGLTFYGISEERANAAAIGMVIGLREKYARPQVLIYRVNNDGTETLIREQR